MILLADANILIDLGYVGGLQLLTQIEETEVLDLVLQECEDDKQPQLIQEIEECGITTVNTEKIPIRDIIEIQKESDSGLSIADSANFYHAKTKQRSLLTGEAALRNFCAKKRVSHHGSIWLVEQAFANQYVRTEELCRWLNVWPSLGRRLPKEEISRLKNELDC